MKSELLRAALYITTMVVTKVIYAVVERKFDNIMDSEN